ncbi:Meiotic recombination protein REC8 like protein [Eufriesea mexicana]|uniref:Meiotic recombination protein REC8 like protein n=1 Tax=Eufriesea mexicana TaxID=516756 RepID=A0A310SRQ2_9HYME|nr:Meiotic recombination protein REC8 like protein [Eufriesea mexicana]
MFYSSELLSLRRKGKLARCWLAATFSEKMFKKVCKPALIKKINVTLICEDILSTIEIRNGKNYGRFSLYLSSQLMYGATRILFYQTKFFQGHKFFNLKIKNIVFHRHIDEFNVVTSLELPEVPSINEVFRNLEMSSNLHLITEEPYTSAIEHLMQDEMNFGILSNHEMEKFILPGVEELSLNEIRRFHWDESAKIPDESMQISLNDINKFEIENVETERGTRLASAGKDQRESLLAVEDYQAKKLVCTTPKKRTLNSPIETPTKKSKIISINELPPLPIESSSALITEPILAPELLFQLGQKTVSVFRNIELNEIIKPRRKKKLFDKQIKLTDTVMRKCIGNITVHTKPQFITIQPSANEYLRQPSMKIFNKSWGKTLTKFFNRYFTKPLMVQNEFENVLDFKIGETIGGETLRLDNSSKLQNQTGELSSKIVSAIIETTDPSKTLDRIIPTENIQTKVLNEKPRRETKEFEGTMIELPEITSFEEKIGYNLLSI